MEMIEMRQIPLFKVNDSVQTGGLSCESMAFVGHKTQIHKYTNTCMNLL